MAFTYLKVKSAKCLCLLLVVLVLNWSWSCYLGLGLDLVLGLVSSGLIGLDLKTLVLFTSSVCALLSYILVELGFTR